MIPVDLFPGYQLVAHFRDLNRVMLVTSKGVKWRLHTCVPSEALSLESSPFRSFLGFVIPWLLSHGPCTIDIWHQGLLERSFWGGIWECKMCGSIYEMCLRCTAAFKVSSQLPWQVRLCIINLCCCMQCILNNVSVSPNLRCITVSLRYGAWQKTVRNK